MRFLILILAAFASTACSTTDKMNSDERVADRAPASGLRPFICINRPSGPQDYFHYVFERYPAANNSREMRTGDVVRITDYSHGPIGNEYADFFVKVVSYSPTQMQLKGLSQNEVVQMGLNRPSAQNWRKIVIKPAFALDVKGHNFGYRGTVADSEKDPARRMSATQSAVSCEVAGEPQLE